MVSSFLKTRLLFLCLLLLCNKVFAQNDQSALVFKAEYILENHEMFGNTKIGGISGIEYVSGNIYYFISDDPGEHGAPRFYKGNIVFNKKGEINDVQFLSVTSLKAPQGKSFTSSAANNDTNKYVYSDAESIRYDKTTNQFMWSSEGYNSKGLFFQPSIYNMDTSGLFISRMTTDPLFIFDRSEEKGVQHNAAFEALSFIPDGDNIIYCTEKSLLQDIHSLKDELKPIRLTICNKTSGTTLFQFAYPIEDVYKNNSNGIVEILAVSSDTFLVLERAFEMKSGCSVRLYKTTLNNSVTNIKSMPELNGKQFIFLKKELILDFSKTTIKHIDNIEGMTWGKPISGNKKSLLFVSDNNFNPLQITQLLSFEFEGQ